MLTKLPSALKSPEYILMYWEDMSDLGLEGHSSLSSRLSLSQLRLSCISV